MGAPGYSAAGGSTPTRLPMNDAGAEDSAIALKAQGEGRVLITLDLDFANIRAYPPAVAARTFQAAVT
jgi:predicted nuclease of predicted toxin-antitoxin system